MSKSLYPTLIILASIERDELPEELFALRPCDLSENTFSKLEEAGYSVLAVDIGSDVETSAVCTLVMRLLEAVDKIEWDWRYRDDIQMKEAMEELHSAVSFYVAIWKYDLGVKAITAVMCQEGCGADNLAA